MVNPGADAAILLALATVVITEGPRGIENGQEFLHHEEERALGASRLVLVVVDIVVELQALVAQHKLADLDAVVSPLLVGWLVADPQVFLDNLLERGHQSRPMAVGRHEHRSGKHRIRHLDVQKAQHTHSH